MEKKKTEKKTSVPWQKRKIGQYEKPVGPDYDWTCCSKNCHTHFEEKFINELRVAIWDCGYVREVIRERIAEMRLKELKLPSDSACCLKFAVYAMGTSLNFLYYTPKKNKSLTNTNRSKADVSVMAWMTALLPITDKMPNTDW